MSRLEKFVYFALVVAGFLFFYGAGPWILATGIFLVILMILLMLPWLIRTFFAEGKDEQAWFLILLIIACCLIVFVKS